MSAPGPSGEPVGGEDSAGRDERARRDDLDPDDVGSMRTDQLLIHHVRTDAVVELDEPRRGVATVALVAGIVGLVVSFFVGWGFPIGIAAIVAGIIALRRPVESFAVARWGIALGILSLVYGAMWLAWAFWWSGLPL